MVGGTDDGSFPFKMARKPVTGNSGTSRRLMLQLRLATLDAGKWYDVLYACGARILILFRSSRADGVQL